MSRIKIECPKPFIFQTQLSIRITDMNYGHHLANDAVLGLVHEARLRCLHRFGFNEGDIGGVGLVVGDAAIVYKSQGRWNDEVVVHVSLADFHTFGCSFYYQLLHKESGREIARAKTGILAFDYQSQQLVPLPEKFISVMTEAIQEQSL